MLVREGAERDNDVDQRLACSLAAVAGALNAAAFQAVGFFSANMTGNVSALSDRIALGQVLTGLFFLGIVLAFVGGATFSTLLINAGRRRGMAGIYALSILAEAMLLLLLGGLELGLPAPQRGPVLVLGLSLIMGLQNAVVTRISEARVRTTHVSGMITDIGIEIAMLLDMARGREPRREAALYAGKLRLHGATVLAFLLGGIVGVVTFGLLGAGLLFAAAGVLFLIALNGLRRAGGPLLRPSRPA